MEELPEEIQKILTQKNYRENILNILQIKQKQNINTEAELSEKDQQKLKEIYERCKKYGWGYTNFEICKNCKSRTTYIPNSNKLNYEVRKKLKICHPCFQDLKKDIIKYTFKEVLK